MATTQNTNRPVYFKTFASGLRTRAIVTTRRNAIDGLERKVYVDHSLVAEFKTLEEADQWLTAAGYVRES